jgi:microcystin-dependent protein
MALTDTTNFGLPKPAYNDRGSTESAAFAAAMDAADAALLAAFNLKAPLSSPAFTGTPSLPTGATGVTQTFGNNSTKLATTAFVQAALAGGPFVQTSGDQSIDGIKTFTSFPVTPGSAPTSNYQVSNKKYVDDSIALAGGVSVGGIILYAGATEPSGYFLCDGQAVDREDYATLFAVIGTTYGNGDGSTTFNVPDLRGNVPVGYKLNDSSFGTMGGKGGEKTHTLGNNEIPAGQYSIPGGSGGSYAALYRTGSNSHNNLQPYITLNFIIKY